MTQVVGAPYGSELIRDARRDGRALRVHWHPDDGFVVISLWRGEHCVGTARVAADEVPALIESLRVGLG